MVREILIASDPTPTDGSRSDAKRRAILDVAKAVFLAQGYAATSMSEIAARVGGSKGTLYNYFRSKEELFSAFMVESCQGPAARIFDPLPPIGQGRSVRDSLIEIAVSLMRLLQLPEMLGLSRLVMAEAGRFPELGRMFYEMGPKRGEERFTEYFEAAMAAGRLPRADPRVAGQRLRDLVMSDVYLRRMWGVLDDMPPEALEAHVTQSVEIFLRAFGPANDAGES